MAKKGLDPVDARLRRLYGITLAEYNRICTLSDGGCWICGSKPKTRRLHTDHKHAKGYKKLTPAEKRLHVRGVLCAWCNAGLRKFRDQPQFFDRAAEYLRTYPAQKVLSGIDEPEQGR